MYKMSKKTIIILGSSIIGILILLLIVVWLITVFKPRYYSYETVEENHHGEHSGNIKIIF